MVHSHPSKAQGRLGLFSVRLDRIPCLVGRKLSAWNKGPKAGQKYAEWLMRVVVEVDSEMANLGGYPTPSLDTRREPVVFLPLCTGSRLSSQTDPSQSSGEWEYALGPHSPDIILREGSRNRKPASSRDALST